MLEMMKKSRRLGILLVLSLLVSCGLTQQPEAVDKSSVAQQPAPSPTPEPEPPVRTVLVLDASGSMTAEDVAPSRMAAANQAASSLVATLPENSELAVLTYGTSTGNTDAEKAAGCQDVTTVAQLTAVTDAARPGLVDAINSIKPSGFTPISLALTKAVELLPDGQGTVILVSDGDDTCAPPQPCETARSLSQQYPELSISTVGLSTSSETNPQLACIANSANGLFVTADDTSSLTRRLQVASEGAKARSSLSTTGRGVAQIGADHATIVAQEASFPAWETATEYAGYLPGVAGVLVVISWQDCSYVFDSSSRVLLAVVPDSAQTIDGVRAGDTVTHVQGIYGEPVEVEQGSDGTWMARYWADAKSGNAFTITYDADPRVVTNTIVLKIWLCRCLPPRGQGTEVVVVNILENGQVKPEYTIENQTGWTIDCSSYNGGSYGAVSGIGPNTYSCGSTADNAHSCWKDPSTGSHLLCLNDGWGTIVRRIPATGMAPTTESEYLRPLSLELVDGSLWTVRISGAGGILAEDQTHMYFCRENCEQHQVAEGQEWVLVNGPGSDQVVDRSGETWIAWLGLMAYPGLDSYPDRRPIEVKKAWYITAS